MDILTINLDLPVKARSWGPYMTAVGDYRLIVMEGKLYTLRSHHVEVLEEILSMGAIIKPNFGLNQNYIEVRGEEDIITYARLKWIV